MATVLTHVGEEWAASRLVGSGTLDQVAAYIGWGTGTTAAAKTDTALEEEVAGRASTTPSLTGSGEMAKFSTQATLTAGTALTITEAGLFGGGSATIDTGNLFVRGTFGQINLNTNDQITFTITIDPA